MTTGGQFRIENYRPNTYCTLALEVMTLDDCRETAQNHRGYFFGTLCIIYTYFMHIKYSLQVYVLFVVLFCINLLITDYNFCR